MKSRIVYDCPKCGGEFIIEGNRDRHFLTCDGTVPEKIQNRMTRRKRKHYFNSIRKGGS